MENHHIYPDKSELRLLSAKEKLFEFSICSAGLANLGSTHITHALPNSSSPPCLQQMPVTSMHLLLPHKLLLCALGFEGHFLENKPVTAAGEHIGRWRWWCEPPNEIKIVCSELPSDFLEPDSEPHPNFSLHHRPECLNWTTIKHKTPYCTSQQELRGLSHSISLFLQKGPASGGLHLQCASGARDKQIKCQAPLLLLSVLSIKILPWFCSESRRWLSPRSGEPILFRRLQGLCALVLQLGVQANSTALNKGPAILLQAFCFFLQTQWPFGKNNSIHKMLLTLAFMYWYALKPLAPLLHLFYLQTINS